MKYSHLLVSFLLIGIDFVQCKRSFSVDYQHNTFVKDGEPFRYVSGSIHYFRIPHENWRDRLLKLKASGANAVQTYVEWSSHEPEPGKYSFEGDNDVIAFIKEAQSVGLYVILRPGPYICAERDYGGFPYWLLREDPNMKLRTSDPAFMKVVDSWFSVLLPKIRPLLYSNGGPIITVQIENEYGSFGCDKEYLRLLRDMVKGKLVDDVVLFTTDGYGDEPVKCGSVDGVLATVDFGVSTDTKTAFDGLKKIQPQGPLVNSEFYPGWLDHWAEPHHTVESGIFVEKLDQLLAMNASVNIYVFHGGTNFGFTSGANEFAVYQAQPTSYDYDSPISEAGDLVPKFFDIQKTIKKYLPIPPIPIPKTADKGNYGILDNLCFIQDVFQFVKEFSHEIHSFEPMSFENISQPNGFVLYSTLVPIYPNDPSILKVSGLKDRAHVFVNKKFKGILSRERKAFELPLTEVRTGDLLELLVENQGRINFGSGIQEVKGIVGFPTLDNMPLANWTHQNLFLHDEGIMDKLVSKECQNVPPSMKYSFTPSFFKATFSINEAEARDTFLRLDGWSKGVAFINGFNLGRYWPKVGPQHTLYIPKNRLMAQGKENKLIIFELESSPCLDGERCKTVELVDYHIINATTPFPG